jgi:hypothetical protein
MAERLGDQHEIGSGNGIDGAFTPSAKKTIEYHTLSPGGKEYK